MLTPITVITSRALIQASTSQGAARTAHKRPGERFGQPRPSSIWTLGVRLFNRAASIRLPKALTGFLASVRTRYAGWRLRRATRTVVDALDDLIILNTRPWPSNLNVLLCEIESRKRRWHVAGLERSTMSN